MKENSRTNTCDKREEPIGCKVLPQRIAEPVPELLGITLTGFFFLLSKEESGQCLPK